MVGDHEGRLHMVTEHDVLHVQLFGAFTLTHDGEQLPPLPSRHARLLFAWLALQRGRPQPRSLLCDRLWPDVPESRARRRLSHALWQIQDAFGEGLRRPYLLTPGDHVQFDVEAPYRLDVEEFEQRLDAVDRAGTSDVEAVRHLRRCVELYRGDFLAGSYEDWVVREQDRLRQRQVTALVRLVDACKQRGNFDEALAVARRLTHQAPLREEAHREVMKLCVLTGQPDLALEQFERCRSVLAEELGVEPTAATVELQDRILQRRHTETAQRAPRDELASHRLVARDEERIVLVDALERTLLGRHGTVFVEGEPGVGKTQLLAHTAEDARWRGFTVLWGGCDDTTAPYAPLRAALDAALDPVRTAQLRALLAPVWLAEAGRLLPALRDDATQPGGALDGPDAAERMRQALVEVVVGLAVNDPVVLVLEDLHSADAETMAVLRSLARHPAPGRLLVLLSYRDVDARQDDAVWGRLRDLDRDARPTRLHLDALTPFATGALLREVLGEAQLPASFVEAVQREGGGNPLYTLELLRSLRDTGALSGGTEHLDAGSVPVTADLRALVRNRLALLGWEAATVAEFAAVLDGHTDLTSLEAGVGLGPRQLSTAVGELTRRNLLQHDGGVWRFTHAATRRVLLDDLLPRRRQELHAAAADALEAAYPDDVEAIAEHLVRAGLPRRALPHLRRAAERALELHAHATAAHHLDAALDAIDRVPSDVRDRTALLLQAEAVHDVLGDRARQQVLLDDLAPFTAGDAALTTELAMRRAHLLGHLDELDAALEYAHEAVDAAPDDDLRGRALATVGELLHWQGHQEQAVAALQAALAARGAGSSAPATRTRATLASALRSLQRYDDARAILADAVTTAEEQGDEVGLVHALGGLADLDAETGHSEEAVARYGATIAQARTVGFRHREGVALVNLATVRLGRGEPAPALAAYDDAETVFRTLGNRRGTAIVRLNRAWLHHRWLGRDDDAERDALAALDYSIEVGSTGLTSAAQETLAGIARRHGEFEVAADHLAAGLAAAEGARDRRAAVQLHRGRAELELAQGEQDAALATAAAAAEEAAALGLVDFVADLRALGALAAAELGRSGEAVRLARAATTELATSGEPHRVHHNLALVAEATDAPATAVEHHRAAVRLLAAALEPLPPELRDSAQRVPAHLDITTAAEPHLPRYVELRLARADAPLGRALERDETIVVELAVAPQTRDPAARRAHLLDVLQQVEDQHAAATLDDLGMVFDVSATTIRRDLEALRREGHDVPTRGRDAG